ncbi:MAG: AlpA family phage regulatory protein [Rhodospirillales bacterium]|nr:AlpA family phage regulatory protein [Rhodospirillales bacterium]
MVDRILRIKEVCDIVHVHRSTLYKMMGRGEFPRPLRLGPASRGWRQSDIDKWMQDLPEVEIRSM